MRCRYLHLRKAMQSFCEKCNKTFDQPGSVSKQNTINFVCNVCKNDLSEKAHSNKYPQKLAEKSEASLKCNKAISKNKIINGSLQDQSLETHRCICGETFLNESALKKHIQSHTKKKSHVCNDKTFSKKILLKDHLKIHNRKSFCVRIM